VWKQHTTAADATMIDSVQPLWLVSSELSLKGRHQSIAACLLRI
jgi:hypothetical protein